MPAKTKTKHRTRYRRLDADVVAEIDALVKSGRYPSRDAVLEAVFAALKREKSHDEMFSGRDRITLAESIRRTRKIKTP